RRLPWMPQEPREARPNDGVDGGTAWKTPTPTGVGERCQPEVESPGQRLDQKSNVEDAEPPVLVEGGGAPPREPRPLFRRLLIGAHGSSRAGSFDPTMAPDRDRLAGPRDGGDRMHRRALRVQRRDVTWNLTGTESWRFDLVLSPALARRDRLQVRQPLLLDRRRRSSSKRRAVVWRAGAAMGSGPLAGR